MHRLAFQSVEQIQPGSDGFLIQKILVALDCGDQTSKVLEAALAIGRSFGSELFLVHAVSIQTPEEASANEDTRFLDACVRAGMRKVKDAVAARPSLNSLRHHEIAAAEPPFDLIQRVVASEKIDLIIAGSHGAAGLQRLAIGSFSEGLMRRVTCPTLIVGPLARVCGDPFRAVLLATSLGESCACATRFVSAIAKHSGGELYALHVIEQNHSVSPAPPAAKELTARQQMREALPSDITAMCSVQLIARHGSPEDMIVDTALRCGAGVIVTGVSEGMLHDEHSLWSTFAAIVRTARCPVLAIRNDPRREPSQLIH